MPPGVLVPLTALAFALVQQVLLALQGTPQDIAIIPGSYFLSLIPDARLRDKGQDLTQHVRYLRHLTDVGMRLAVTVKEPYHQKLEQLVHVRHVEMLRSNLSNVELCPDQLDAADLAITDQLLQVKVSYTDLPHAPALNHSDRRCRIGLEVHCQVDIKVAVDILQAERLVHNRFTAVELCFARAVRQLVLASAIDSLHAAPHTESSARCRFVFVRARRPAGAGRSIDDVQGTYSWQKVSALR